jgi:xylose isomerase
VTADRILGQSPYLEMRRQRYASYDSGDGARFERGELKLEDLVTAAVRDGEPQMISGKQERYEQLLTLYL